MDQFKAAGVCGTEQREAAKAQAMYPLGTMTARSMVVRTHGRRGAWTRLEHGSRTHGRWLERGARTSGDFLPNVGGLLPPGGALRQETRPRRSMVNVEWCLRERTRLGANEALAHVVAGRPTAGERMRLGVKKGGAGIAETHNVARAVERKELALAHTVVIEQAGHDTREEVTYTLETKKGTTPKTKKGVAQSIRGD